MLIADNYLLMIPSFIDDTPNKVVLYEAGALLDLQNAEKELAGHPSVDLPGSGDDR